MKTTSMDQRSRPFWTNRITAAALLMAALGVRPAFGSGFSLYQASAVNNAMGGALIGKAMDASANFSNPATLTDLTNICVTVGFVTEHPRGRLRVNRNGQSLGEHGMEPGMFTLPHFQLAVPLPFDFAFGFGIMPEYGLGTAYSDNWCMRWNCTETTVQALVFNPNLAFKITDKWSVGAGLRWLYFDFEQDGYPSVNNPYTGQTACTYKSHLHGDNHWEDIGWQVGTKYDIFDNLAVGLVYKSQIDSRIRGNSDVKYMDVTKTGVTALDYANAQVAKQVQKMDGDAEADLRLPQSIAGGVNWDITDDWHWGVAAIWTQWSTVDTLVFDLNGNNVDKPLGWRDTWRVSTGVAYDVSEDWTVMLSYVYDMDSTDKHQCSVMLPPADRHIASCGVTWNVWDNLYLTVCYSCIFMHGKGMQCYDTKGDGSYYDVTVSRGFCHAAGCSISYKF